MASGKASGGQGSDRSVRLELRFVSKVVGDRQGKRASHWKGLGYWVRIWALPCIYQHMDFQGFNSDGEWLATDNAIMVSMGGDVAHRRVTWRL